MTSEKTKAFSFPKKMLGWLLLGLVIAASIGFGFLVSGTLFHGPSSDATRSSGAFPVAAIVIFMALGMLSLSFGVISYVAVLATTGLTFRYDRPVWLTGFTLRLRLFNIFVPLLLLMGIGSFATAIFGTMLLVIGLPTKLALLLPFFAVLVPGQFFLAWFNVWAPLEKPLVRKRLAAMGITRERMQEGIYAGISDPSVSSLRKGVIEDDVGMMWLEPDAIVYQGDARRLEIKRDRLVQIEREVDKGSMAAYAGAVYVILVWTDDAGTQNRTRLHVMNCFTLTGVARALDALADKLTRWQKLS